MIYTHIFLQEVTYLASKLCNPDRFLELSVPLLNVLNHSSRVSTVVVNREAINLEKVILRTIIMRRIIEHTVQPLQPSTNCLIISKPTGADEVTGAKSLKPSLALGWMFACQESIVCWTFMFAWPLWSILIDYNQSIHQS